MAMEAKNKQMISAHRRGKINEQQFTQWQAKYAHWSAKYELEMQLSAKPSEQLYRYWESTGRDTARVKQLVVQQNPAMREIYFPSESGGSVPGFTYSTGGSPPASSGIPGFTSSNVSYPGGHGATPGSSSGARVPGFASSNVSYPAGHGATQEPASNARIPSFSSSNVNYPAGRGAIEDSSAGAKPPSFTSKNVSYAGGNAAMPANTAGAKTPGFTSKNVSYAGGQNANSEASSGAKPPGFTSKNVSYAGGQGANSGQTTNAKAPGFTSSTTNKGNASTNAAGSKVPGYSSRNVAGKITADPWKLAGQPAIAKYEAALNKLDKVLPGTKKTVELADDLLLTYLIGLGEGIGPETKSAVGQVVNFIVDHTVEERAKTVIRENSAKINRMKSWK